MKTWPSPLVGLLTLLVTLVSAPAPGLGVEDWQPYIQVKDERKPFPADPGKVKDKEWLGVGYPEFGGGFRPRLAVVFSEDGEAAAQLPDNPLLRDLYRLSRASDEEDMSIPAENVEDMVRQALGATGRFTMLERTTAKDDVIEEQDMGASGRADKKTAPSIGKIKGADFIVKATILELNPEKDSKDIKVAAGGLGGGALGIGSVGVSGKVAFCRLNVRLINATTSEVVQDMTVDGTANESSLGIGGGFVKGLAGKVIGGGGKVDSKKGMVISNAIQACANKIAFYTSEKLASLPWVGTVVSVSPLAVNAGTNVGLAPGLELNLYAKGEEMLDEDGSSLGFTKTLIGRIRVADVQERFSTCEIISGGESVMKGDIVELSGKATSDSH